MRNRLRLACVFAVLSVITLLPASGRAQKVAADKKGGLSFTDAVGKRSPLASGGKASSPSLDPQKHQVVFVRATPGVKIETATGEAQATELCLMDVDGKKPPAVLVRGADNPEPEKNLADFDRPQFSPDGKTIYFVSAAWATSGAIHSVDPNTGKVGFVCAGGDLEVVPSGEYAGDLLVRQHRYFVGGGSYDWVWLLKPDGTEIGPVGETTEVFKESCLEKRPEGKKKKAER